MIKVEIQKIVQYPPNKGYVVLLREVGGNKQLPIIVGTFEAQAIALALENVDMPRPLTHDLIVNILKTLSMKITKVIVNDLRENTFFARVFLENETDHSSLQIDARPSDAIAIGLRMRAPLFVSDLVMDAAGQIAAVQKNTTPPANDVAPEMENLDKLFDLQTKLQNAINEENYELAAKLRDQISAFERGEN
ncbi:MAG: bifunctional nuclease family protein [Candidatus Marinimicrobia bacterium]|nr:bifunctional nuclease family protein [Candidatus Neomarinimicrobiota bacterium]